MADEDDDAQAQQADDEDRDAGSESDGAGGEDTAGRAADGEISAQQPDAEADEGAPSSRHPAEHAGEPRGSSARERYQRLANENRDYRERLDRIEREREQERQNWARQQQTLNDQQERERLNLMTPEERSEYRIQQFERNNNARLQQSEMRMLMQMDKAHYDTQAASNPVYRRMASEVERVFQEQVRKGQPVERQVILENLIGKQALNGAASSGTQRRAPRKRVEQERATPTSNRSSTTVQSRKVSTAEERLKDVLI